MGVLGFTLFTANLRAYANSHNLFLLNSLAIVFRLLIGMARPKAEAQRMRPDDVGLHCVQRQPTSKYPVAYLAQGK